MRIYGLAITFLLLGGMLAAQAQNSFAMLTNNPYAATNEQTDYFSNPTATTDTNLPKTAQDLNYRVLLGVFTHRIPIESDYWSQVRNDLSVTDHQTGYAYSVGFFRNRTEAEKKCRELVAKGYLYAKVALFAADDIMQEVAP